MTTLDDLLLELSGVQFTDNTGAEAARAKAEAAALVRQAYAAGQASAKPRKYAVCFYVGGAGLWQTKHTATVRKAEK